MFSWRLYSVGDIRRTVSKESCHGDSLPSLELPTQCRPYHSPSSITGSCQLAMQNLKSYPRPVTPKSAFWLDPKGGMCIKFKKPCSNLSFFFNFFFRASSFWLRENHSWSVNTQQQRCFCSSSSTSPRRQDKLGSGYKSPAVPGM